MTSTTAEPMTSDAETTRKGYARPEVLVTTEWLAAHLNDPAIRILFPDLLELTAAHLMWLDPSAHRAPPGRRPYSRLPR